MKEDKTDYRQFINICVIAFAIFFSNQMVQNTVTKFAKSMLVSTQTIGFLGGMWGLAALLTRPFSGQVIDNEDHKKILVLCVFVLFLSNVLLLVADNVVLLFLSRAVNGIAWGFGSTLCMTTACNALPKEKMTGGIGIYTMMQVLAQVLGPSLAVFLIDHASYKVLYMVTTFCMLGALALTPLFKTNHKRLEKRSYAFSLRAMFSPKAFLPASLLMSNIMQISAVSAFLLLLADERGVKGLSLFFTFQAISIIATRPFVSKFINDKNKYLFTLSSEVLLISGLIVLFFARTTVGFLCAAILFGLGKSGSHPALMGMCVSDVPVYERGRASNTAYTFQDLGQIFGSSFAGVFASLYGYASAFLSVAVVIVLFSLVFICFYMVPHLKAVKELT